MSEQISKVEWITFTEQVANLIAEKRNMKIQLDAQGEQIREILAEISALKPKVPLSFFAENRAEMEIILENNFAVLHQSGNPLKHVLLASLIFEIKNVPFTDADVEALREKISQRFQDLKGKKEVKLTNFPSWLGE